MRMMKKGNKGAALVSVLVATTFMTVLITTLLYMSYMNYLTKSMRHASTDNFYTDEFALDDLATSLQQVGAKGIDGGKNDVVEYAKAADGLWDKNKLQALIKVASKEANITVSCPDGKDPIMNVTSNTVTFKNVKLTSKTHGNYESNIVSDITLAWPQQPEKSYGVYDFSLISDSQFEVQKGQCAIGGCLYVRQQPDKDYAIKVDSSGVLNLNCPTGVVHGKIIVEDGGALCIGGDIYVTGGVDIQSGGMMFVTGNLTYAGTAPEMSRVKGRTTNVKKYSDDDDQCAAWVQQFNNLAGPDGFAGSIANTKVKIKKGGATAEWFYGYTDVSGDMAMFRNVKFGENRTKESKALTEPAGQHTYAQVIGSSLDTFNDGCFSDSLVVTNNPKLNIRGDLSNSTIIEAAKDINIIIDIKASPTYLGKMTEEGYEKAKDVLFNGKPGTLDYGSASFKSGYFSEYEHDPNLIAFSTSGSDFTTETLNYYRIGDDNVLPVGSLISPDAEAAVADLMNIVNDSTTSPADSFVIYNNWYKE